MFLTRHRACARAGLLGNPSDGYHGRTIALALKNFAAEVVLYEWDSVDIVLTERDRATFGSVGELAHDVRRHGYYGGIRLVKATIKQFVDYCAANNIELHDRNFSIRYSSNIPQQVGLGGSSAIVVATLRCLMDFYDVRIPIEIQPSLALQVEQAELGIAAGLQDRVSQAYQGLVFMDFDLAVARRCAGLTHFHYEPLPPDLLPPLYLAYHHDLSEPTEVVHNHLRARFDRGDRDVIDAMRHCAELARQGRDALLAGDRQALASLIDANFDTRRSICQLPAGQVRMIETARGCGASAKFAGSGGAIIGTCEDEAMFSRLRKALASIGCRTIRPDPAPATVPVRMALP